MSSPHTTTPEPRQRGQSLRAPALAALALALLTGVVSCAPRAGPGPEPERVPAPERTRPAPAREDAPVARYREGSYRYELLLDGSVEVRGGPTAAQGNASVRTGSYLTLNVAPEGDGARMRVVVDSFMVLGEEPRISPPASADLAPHTLEMLVRDAGRSERVAPPATLGCPGRSPLEGAMQTLIVPLPSGVRAGTRWEDTVVTLSCRDALPITTVHVHRYTATGFAQRDGRRLLRVRRESQSSIEGSTVRRGQAVGLSGSGTGRAELEIDQVTGAVVTGEGSSTTTLALQGSAEAVEVRQRVEMRVRRVD